MQLQKSRVAAPPPGEEWDVDDEEAMASPLYSVTPHATKRFEENLVLSPYAPAVTRRPSEMKVTLKSDRYLSMKEMSGTANALSLTHLPTGKSRLGMTITPSKRPQLRPNSMKSSSLLTERKPFKPKLMRSMPRPSFSDVLSKLEILKLLLSLCGLSSVAALRRVNAHLRRSWYVARRFRNAMISDMDFTMRMRYWNSFSEKIKPNDTTMQFFRQSQSCLKEIQDDIVRTPSFIPHQTLTQKQQASLMLVLNAVCTYNPDVGYCQGMNYIGGFLVQVMPSEEECFWMMNTLLNEYKLKNLLKNGLTQLKLMCFQMDCLMQAYLQNVRSHLKALGVSTEVYSAKWFLTLMCYELPYQLTMQVWDLFLFKGWKVFFRVILAVLSLSQEELLAADSSSISHILKTLPRRVKPHETVLKVAFMFKVTRRLLSDLEPLYARNCKGRYQIVVGKSRKREWVVTPKMSETSEDSSLASRLMSKVWQLLGREAQSREDTQLDNTICLEEVPLQTEFAINGKGDVSLLSNEELKQALSIRDLDSGKVYYQDVPTPKSCCTVCGSSSHSSQFCTEDIDMTPRIIPALHLHPKVQESFARLA